MKGVVSVAAVAVVGSLNMDLVIRAPRPPLRGETLLGGAFGMTGGGKGSNQALAAARLRADSCMVGCVGDDDFGRHLRAALVENHVDCGHLEARPDAGTGVAVVTVTDGGERSIILSRGANALLDEAVLERARDVFKSVDAVLFQMESPPETVAAGLHMAHSMGCRTFLSADPPVALPSGAWGLIDCMVLNQMALDFYVSGTSSPGEPRPDAGLPDAEIKARAHRLLERGVREVVVTRSARRGLAFSRSGEFAFEPFKVDVVDTTGARDAFCAGLCVGIAEGMPMRSAARFAAAAGALACTRIGAHPSMPWRHEVEALLEATPE